MEQDHPTLVPPSSDDAGGYDLADLNTTTPPSASPSASPSPSAPAGNGFLVDLQAPATPKPAAEAPRAEEEVKKEEAQAKTEDKPRKDKAKKKSSQGGGLLGGLFGKKGGKAKDKTRPDQPGEAEAARDAAAEGKPKEKGGPKLRVKRKRKSWKHDMPAWAVSLIVHLSVLSMLAVATVAPKLGNKPKDINAAPFDPTLSKQQAEELVHILADPTEMQRDQAVAETPTNTPGPSTGLGTGAGAPSATPSVAARSGVGERSLPNVQVVPQLSPVATMSPRAPRMDLQPGGMIAGDVTAETGSIGEALDQLAREILRHLQQHKLTVVWLFDESGSMKDDQQAVKDKFDRVSSELKLNVTEDKRSANALTHVIVSFGAGMHAPMGKPTGDIDLIGRSIDKIPVDETGTENTLQAIGRVIGEYGRLISKERKLLIVLITDESGDDGSYVEEARQAAVSRGVPIYIIGRQSLFGYDRAHLLYVDPVTKDHYWPTIKRGPETADLECLQWDGLHGRRDEQPSGFAPYELARMAKDTGGIYFLLPSEENMRVRQREKAYSMSTLKEYVPDYKGRQEYVKIRNNSQLRSTLYQIIQQTKGFGFRHHYPITYTAFAEALSKEVPVVQQRLKALIEIEKILRALKKARDREPDKRWQAHYDLILGQIVVSQIKAYEYLACLDEMVGLLKQGKLKPKVMPVPGKLMVEWSLNHSKAKKAPKKETEKKYAEAMALLKDVIKKHPKTPWADLAQDYINRGFGVSWGEWRHNPQYSKRAKLVPKY